MTEEFILETMATPDGAFTMLAAPDGAVVSSGWTADRGAILGRLRAGARPVAIRDGVTGHAAAVRAYYDGELTAIDAVPVRQSGTELQLRGWRALRQIDPGSPLTYAEFARQLHSPDAVRAVAGICARNAPALFVPCHRVVRSDGTMGGFAWGVDVKRSLLAREGATDVAGLF